MSEELAEEEEFQSVIKIEDVEKVFDDFLLHFVIVDEHHRIIYANRIVRNEFGDSLRDVLFSGCAESQGDVGDHAPSCPVCMSARAGYVPVKLDIHDRARGARLTVFVCPLSVGGRGRERVFLCILLDEESYSKAIWNEGIYRAIFQNTPNVVGVFSERGVVVDANPVMVECFGSDLVGRNISDVLPPELSERWMNYILCSINECRKTTFEFSCNGKHYLMSMVPVSIGSERYCLLIGRDVTELKRREALLKAMVNIEKMIDSEKDRQKLLEGVCSELSALPDYLLVRVDLTGEVRLTVSSGKLSDAVPVVRCETMDRAVRGGLPFVRRVSDCSGECGLKGEVGDQEVWITSLPLRSGRTYGALTVYHSRILGRDELEILETISSDISFALRAFELEELRVLAHRRIEDIIYRSALLTDEIKNALMVISGIAELMISGKESAKILEQVERIKKILEEIDKGWVESEKLKKFLKRFM